MADMSTLQRASKKSEAGGGDMSAEEIKAMKDAKVEPRRDKRGKNEPEVLEKPREPSNTGYEDKALAEAGNKIAEEHSHEHYHDNPGILHTHNHDHGQSEEHGHAHVNY